MSSRSRADAVWAPAIAIGSVAERIARLSGARAMLQGVARSLGSSDARIVRRDASVFSEYACDAAAAFGGAGAAAELDPVLCALIEGIKIIDDIQDGEEHCLATQIGEERAMATARAALAYGLELAATLPLDDEPWRAALAAIGRGIRETAAGQQLEASAKVDFESFWNVVDHKTPPLVATALELGALAAGASTERAAALTRLAIPLGRLLQIGDDCNDALGPNATDWRAPHLNLLMLYSLCGPHGDDLAALLQPATLHEAQLWLLRDGALSYALHAQKLTLDAMAATLDSLALPDPGPFVRVMEQQREQAEKLLAKMSA